MRVTRDSNIDTVWIIIVALRCPICIDFREGGGRGGAEYPEKNPKSTEEINCENSLLHETPQTRLTACVTRASQFSLVNLLLQL